MSGDIQGQGPQAVLGSEAVKRGNLGFVSQHEPWLVTYLRLQLKKEWIPEFVRRASVALTKATATSGGDFHGGGAGLIEQLRTVWA